MNFSKFQSKETVRIELKGNETTVKRSPELSAVVPSGQRYGYDLMAHVGLEHFLRGRKLQDIHDELSNKDTPLTIPFSSLFDVSRKFLYYFGLLHSQAASVIKEYYKEKGGMIWLIDGTIEPGTPVFFGIKEPQSSILLDCWKIPTENVADIAHCLSKCAKKYGKPDTIYHDLSKAISTACDLSLPGVKHRVCHYHLLSDIGKGLYADPQAELEKCIRHLKIRARLKEQRHGQTKLLRKRLQEPNNFLLLSDILKGKEIDENTINDVLGREVYFVIQDWILDYPNDGSRQGFPFDPYTLYFHRRIKEAYDNLELLLSTKQPLHHAPKVLWSLLDMLKNYLNNSAIVEAAEKYEVSYQIFNVLRDALRLSAKGNTPMQEVYRLNWDEQCEMQQELENVRETCKTEVEEQEDPNVKKNYQIVLTHLNRYWPHLISKNKSPNADHERTTNALEGHWRISKRTRRKVHGKSTLTIDFRSLPSEYMLVPNLNNPTYIDLVLGKIDLLPEKLAEVGKSAKPFYKREKGNHEVSIGRLPKKIMRKENFMGDLKDMYIGMCR